MKQNLTKWVRLITFFLGAWLVAYGIIAVTGNVKAPAVKVVGAETIEIINTTVKQPSVNMRQLRRDLDCLARNIYWEARSEPYHGMVAVAQVTLNRVEHKSFPDDICDVVYQGPTRASWKDSSVYYPIKHRCQFSWYCDGKSDHIPSVNQTVFDRCYEVARQVLIEGKRLPGLKQAVFYHADYVSPGWRYPKLAKIGTHIFYGDRKSRN